MARPLAHQRRRRRRGDAVIEFALLAPTLLLLLFGILEVGRVLDTWLIVQNAVREGAREAAEARLSQDPTTVAQQATLAYLNAALAGRGDVSIPPLPTPYVDANVVQVSAEVDVQIYTPLFQSMLPSPVPVRATTSMRRQ
jgi:Flp pilus assembly protein TadG